MHSLIDGAVLAAGNKEEVGEGRERCPTIHPAIKPESRYGAIANGDGGCRCKEVTVSKGTWQRHARPGFLRRCPF
jgi:hypothetical protein